METLIHHLFSWSQEEPKQAMQMRKINGNWSAISVRECADNVEAVAKYLRSQNVGQNDVALIYAYNSPEWVHFDLAVMLTGAASAGIYINASLTHIQHILKNSEAKILFVDRLEDAKKIFGDQSPETQFPNLKKVICSSEEPFPEWAISLKQVIAQGQEMQIPSAESMLQSLNAKDRATLIYTSGTTGLPKGVSLSHGNLTFAALGYSVTWDPPQQGQLFSFLPLAHIAERMSNLGVGLTRRYTVYFCSSPLSIASEMKEVQPTISLCVPRLWDKLKEGVESKLEKAEPKRKKMIENAMQLSRKYWDKKLNSQWVNPLLWLKYQLADRVILSKIREQMGLKEARRAVSGAAALSMDTLHWYRGIGINLIEAYALSETTGALTCGVGTLDTSGTVGVPYPDIELRLASDGEIETRGPHIFQGYFKDPEATAGVFSGEWFKTGDLGKLDAKGWLRIVGRKREIIKSAEGKMISPLAIEARLQASPWIDQAIVIGNERPYLVAILTISENLRKNEGEFVSDTEILKAVGAHVQSVNKHLASHERIKSFRVRQQPFSIESDEMTATLKLKRHVIEKRYASLIEDLYRH